MGFLSVLLAATGGQPLGGWEPRCLGKGTGATFPREVLRGKRLSPRPQAAEDPWGCPLHTPSLPKQSTRQGQQRLGEESQQGPLQNQAAEASLGKDPNLTSVVATTPRMDLGEGIQLQG